MIKTELQILAIIFLVSSRHFLMDTMLLYLYAEKAVLIDGNVKAAIVANGLQRRQPPSI